MASRRKSTRPDQPSRRAQLAAQQQAAARSKKRNRIITAVAAGVVLLLMAAGVVQQVRSQGNEPPTAASAADVTVRDNSHRLSDVPDGKVTFVEFLDFECEACGAAFPAVEELRATFGDRVTFVARYFPLDGHFNSQRAARAVEAAAQQGQFEAMYKKMFETQTQWSEQQVPKDDLFRSYAEELGLDMTKWDAAYASDATWARIQADIDDGTALGVTSTPSFFLNGQRLEPKSIDDLTTAIEQALDQQ
jgi:protein-disulfide isomerase